jgi:hypothetical protein
MLRKKPKNAELEGIGMERKSVKSVIEKLISQSAVAENRGFQECCALYNDKQLKSLGFWGIM